MSSATLLLALLLACGGSGASPEANAGAVPSGSGAAPAASTGTAPGPANSGSGSGASGPAGSPRRPALRSTAPGAALLALPGLAADEKCRPAEAEPCEGSSSSTEGTSAGTAAEPGGGGEPAGR